MLQFQVLNNPTTEEFQVAINSSAPDIVYLQGEQSGDSDEVGPLVLGYADYSTPDALLTLFGSTLPTTVGAILRFTSCSQVDAAKFFVLYTC